MPNILCHNPVYTKDSYLPTYCTFNIHNKKKNGGKALTHVKDLIAPDIFFLQEIYNPDTCRELLTEYALKYNEHKGNAYTGVLVKRDTFKVIKKEKADELLYSIRDRQCTLVLEHCKLGHTIIAISWHGRQCAMSNDAKRADHKELQQFAMKMQTKYNAVVIIGGDFNFAVKKLEECLEKDFQVHAPESTELKGNRKKKQNIDYFVTLSTVRITVDSVDINKVLRQPAKEKEKRQNAVDVEQDRPTFKQDKESLQKLMETASHKQIQRCIEIFKEEDKKEEYMQEEDMLRRKYAAKKICREEDMQEDDKQDVKEYSTSCPDVIVID